MHPSVLVVARAGRIVAEYPATAVVQLKAEAGLVYGIVEPATGQPPRGLVLRREGNDLRAEVDGELLALLTDFYAEDGLPVFSLDGSLEPGVDQQILGGLDGGADVAPGVVWSAAEDTHKAAILFGAVALFGTGIALESDADPASNLVAVNVVAGPVIEGHGLLVEVFAADGQTKLGEALLDDSGRIEIDVGAYTGVVIARVVDTTAEPDYRDESTGAEKDLNAELVGVEVIVGGRASINVNPLTTVAYQKARELAGEGVPLEVTTVQATNAALAAVFGLEDLHATDVVPTVQPDGSATVAIGGDSEAGELYGLILAALSGADERNGGNTELTIQQLVAGITLAPASAPEGEQITLIATLDEDAERRVIEGGYEAKVNEASETSLVVDTRSPIFSSGTAAQADEQTGAGQVVYTAVADDPSRLTYSLKANNDDDAAAFSIDASTGAVTLAGDPDHETKSSYNFTVIATDVAGNATEQVVSLSINDRDESVPVITSGATATAIDENSGAGQVVYTVTATDTADVDDTTDTSGGVTYSLKADTGDAAMLSIDASTGAVTLTGDPDHEAKASYSFTVVATDAAGNATEQAVSLSITDLDESAPVITSSAIATAIDENSGSGQVVYTVTATDTADVDDTTDTSAALRYSLKAGNNDDVTAFSIDNNTGAVTLTANPDHETQPSYNFTVIATDAAGNASEQSVTLAITNLGPSIDLTAPTTGGGALTSNTLQVPDNPTGNGIDPTLTALANGGFAAAWQGVDSGASGGDRSIYVQRFDTAGSPAGTAYQLEAPRQANEIDGNPAVMALGDGGFVVAWQGRTDQYSSYLKDNGVYAQKFDASGSPVGAIAELGAADGDLTGFSSNPGITALGADGAYALTWQNGEDYFAFSTSLVQIFDTDGAAVGNPIDLQDPEYQVQAFGAFDHRRDERPSIIEVDDGFVVARHVSTEGGDGGADGRILIQQFTENPQADSGFGLASSTLLGPPGISTSGDRSIRLIDLGNGNGYVVAWLGGEGAGNKIYAQRFAADGTTTVGTMHEFRALDVNGFDTRRPEIAAVGTDGSYVVAWSDADNDDFGSDLFGSDLSVYVQQFDASSVAITTEPVRLDPADNPDKLHGYDGLSIAAFADGSYTVVWAVGFESTIYAQDFNADGTVAGDPAIIYSDSEVSYRALTDTTVVDDNLVVTFFAEDSSYNATAYVLRRTTASDDGSYSLTSSETGTAYVVATSVTVNDVADITAAPVTQWKSFAITQANAAVTLDLDGLPEGEYAVYAADAAGALSAAATETITIADVSIVVFDLVGGVSSDHSDRTFDPDTTYDIYIRVDSDTADLNTNGPTGADVTGTWGAWKGADQLGTDDRLILVGNGEPVIGTAGLPVVATSVAAASLLWIDTSGLTAAAFTVERGNQQTPGKQTFWRYTSGHINKADLFTGPFNVSPTTGNWTPAAYSLPYNGQGYNAETGPSAKFAQVYMTTMPPGILTSQGLFSSPG